MSKSSKTLVMKFGGTSVGSADAIRQVVEIVRNTRQDWGRVVVVTSALSGVTNVLLESATRAAKGDLSAFYQAVRDLTERHYTVLTELIPDLARQNQVRQEINHLLNDFSNLGQAIHILGEASPRALDAVASLGERLCVRILAGAIEASGLPAQYVESTQCIITDDQFQNAVPDMEATARSTKNILNPVLDSGRVPVVTGFIGATPTGVITTLGRGGSDYSASILGVALGVDEVWIWTDVNGVMTADPRIVPDARTMAVASYREVAEMAHYGAKVLHPKSIRPVIEAGISLRVCNTFNPQNPGTLLVSEKQANGRGTIKAVAVLKNLRLVTVSGGGMMGVPGIAGRIFTAVADTGVSIPLIIQSSSEQAICFAVPNQSADEIITVIGSRLSREFFRRDIDQASASDDVDVITVVCPGLRTTPGVAGKIFNSLGEKGINVQAISFGGSDISINLIVSPADTRQAMQILHTLIPVA